MLPYREYRNGSRLFRFLVERSMIFTVDGPQHVIYDVGDAAHASADQRISGDADAENNVDDVIHPSYVTPDYYVPAFGTQVKSRVWSSPLARFASGLYGLQNNYLLPNLFGGTDVPDAVADRKCFNALIEMAGILQSDLLSDAGGTANRLMRCFHYNWNDLWEKPGRKQPITDIFPSVRPTRSIAQPERIDVRLRHALPGFIKGQNKDEVTIVQKTLADRCNDAEEPVFLVVYDLTQNYEEERRFLDELDRQPDLTVDMRNTERARIRDRYKHLRPLQKNIRRLWLNLLLDLAYTFGWIVVVPKTSVETVFGTMLNEDATQHAPVTSVFTKTMDAEHSYYYRAPVATHLKPVVTRFTLLPHDEQ